MTTPAPASPVISALLADLFDDAALFPPASLSMGDAFADHLTASQGAFRWMLARFVCPVSRLRELAEAAPRFGDRLRLALVIDDADALDGAPATIDDHGWRVETVEARLADSDVAASSVRLRATADSVGARDAFLEVPWTDYPLAGMGVIAAIAHDANVGLKLRCGGDTADAVPAPGLVAAFILSCRAAGAPLKLTAGLHHPFRHPDPSSGAMLHGFVNVLTAAVFAHTTDAPEEELAQLISDDDREAFVIDGRTLAWRGRGASADDVTSARRALLPAIGSCSFREPVDDLVALGLLAAP